MAASERAIQKHLAVTLREQVTMWKRERQLLQNAMQRIAVLDALIARAESALPIAITPDPEPEPLP